MSNTKFFNDAIAEAKAIRETALANAKLALEEAFTPQIQSMLEKKLSEESEDLAEDQDLDETAISEEMKDKDKKMEEKKEDMDEAKKDDMDEAKKDDMDEAKKDDMDEAKSKDDMDEAKKDDMDEAKDKEMDEAKHDDEKMEEAKDDMDETVEEDLTEVPAVAEEEVEEAEDDSDESDDEANDHEEHPDGDEDISKLSVDQFKDLIRDIINQEMGAGEEVPADDMDGGDIEGMGDEAPIEEPAIDGAEDEEEIDLDELLKELEATTEEVDEAHGDNEKKKVEESEEAVNEDKDPGEKEAEEAFEEGNDIIEDAEKEALSEDKNDLSQALETIKTLKSELNEVNILNSKLLYVNKIFKSNNLTESQKVNIIAAFDKAETVKEVKLVYETVSDNIPGKKESADTIKESKTKLGMASKATGTTASKPEVINEVSDTVRRMQKLAGIIK